jgi:hypothetical protein
MRFPKNVFREVYGNRKIETTLKFIPFHSVITVAMIQFFGALSNPSMQTLAAGNDLPSGLRSSNYLTVFLKF